MKKIKLSIPMDQNVLRSTAAYLTGLADEMEGPQCLEPIYPAVKAKDVMGSFKAVTPPAPEATEEPTEPEVKTASEAFAQTPPPPPTHPEPETTGELDSAGVPWDERIHARTKTKIADGTWKKKRGVDDAVVTQVMAEITGGTPTTPETTPPPPAPSTGSKITTFPELMQAITGAQLHPDRVIEACNSHNVEQVALLATRPDLIPAVAEELGL